MRRPGCHASGKGARGGAAVRARPAGWLDTPLGHRYKASSVFDRWAVQRTCIPRLQAALDSERGLHIVGATPSRNTVTILSLPGCAPVRPAAAADIGRC